MWPLLLAGWVLLAGPFGIDFTYYVHLGLGQWRLIWNQRPVDAVIADPETEPYVRERLTLVQQIRAYAIEQLGLEGSENYTTYTDIGDGPVVWALTAAPPLALEPHRWSYPVVGSAPYRGFFDRERAERERVKFDEKGYDTYLRGVDAFSTLGWFRDPILSTMLDDPAIRLADVIIHELTHATLWIQGDADFNESLAGFVGREGAKLWVVDHYDAGADSLAATARQRKDRRRYRELMHGLAARLDSIYTGWGSREEKLEEKAVEIAEFRALAATVPWETRAYGDPQTWRINNATLALFRTYHRETDVFARVLDVTGGLKNALSVFRACETVPDPEAYLEAWIADQTAPE